MQWPVGGIGRQQRSEDIWTDELAHGKGTVTRASKVDTYIARSVQTQVVTNERRGRGCKLTCAGGENDGTDTARGDDAARAG